MKKALRVPFAVAGDRRSFGHRKGAQWWSGFADAWGAGRRYRLSSELLLSPLRNLAENCRCLLPVARELLHQILLVVP